MRKILMSKPGEFPPVNKADYSRGAAIKMFADLIKQSQGLQATDTSEKQVVISGSNSQQKLVTSG